MALARGKRTTGGGAQNTVQVISTAASADAQVVGQFPAFGLCPDGVQITVDAADDPILTASDTRSQVQLQLVSGGGCRIGPSGVTATTGWFELAGVGAFISLPLPYAALTIRGAPISGTPAVLLVSYITDPVS